MNKTLEMNIVVDHKTIEILDRKWISAEIIDRKRKDVIETGDDKTSLLELDRKWILTVADR